MILPANKYSWMQEMDPGIVVEDPSGNRRAFALLLLIIICLIELIVFITSGKIAGKIIASILYGFSGTGLVDKIFIRMTLPRFFRLGLLVALGCTVVATPLASSTAGAGSAQDQRVGW